MFGNCAKTAEAQAALECSRMTFSNRARATDLQNSAEGQEWTEEIEQSVLSDPGIEVIKSGNIPEYIETVGNRVASARKNPLFTGKLSFYAYRPLSSKHAGNAFAIPGGSIFFSLDLLEQLDESEIAWIIGHEIAHIEWSSYHEGILSQFTTRNRLERLTGKFLSVCEGPMDEVLADQYATEYSIAAGYDPTAGTRVMWGALRDHKLLRSFSIANSHPPTSMRASYIYREAKPLLKSWPYYFRGTVEQTTPWNGNTPEQLKTICD